MNARLRAACSRVVGLLFACATPGMCFAQITINQEAKLYPAQPASSDGHSGTSVSISGTTAAVGAPDVGSAKGAVYIFVRNTGTNVWTLQQTLTASDAIAGDRFGAAVMLSGDIVAVGAPNRASNTGAVYTFNRSGTTWTPGTILTASGGATGDQLGFSVAIEGLTIVAGAPHSSVSSRTDAGTAYVFTSLNSGLTWQQQFHIQVTSGQARGGDHIGWSVALSQGTVLAGAPDDDSGNKTSVGSAYVFVRNGTAWSKQTKITPSGGATNMRFGDSVALVSNTAVIGADGQNSAQGAAYVYTRSGTTWTQQAALTATDGMANDRFGLSVAVSGTQVAVGAPKANNAGAASGKVYVFSYNGTAACPGTGWLECEFLKATDNGAGDNFGNSVALDAGRALAGAPYNPSGAITGNGATYPFVSQSASVTTIANITPEPSVIGQNYTVSVQVASNPAGNGTPTGSVTVSDSVGGTCSIVLDASGAGSCVLATATAGTQTISANYSGDAVFGASSVTTKHVVNGANTTTTIVTETPDPSAVGQAITVTVSVTSTSAGTITGPVTVSGGGATCTITDISVGNSCALSIMTAGSSNIVAIYGGDANFNSSISTAVPHTTNMASTTTTIVTDAANPSTVGQPDTFTVSVTGQYGGTATGKVTVSDGTNQCIIANIATTNTCQITFNTAGTTTLVATYAGDANYSGSVSSGKSHTTVAATTTTTIVSETPDPSFVGQNVQVTVSVTPSTMGTPTGTVTVTAAPSTATCTITLPSATNSCVLTFNSTGTMNLVAAYGGDGNYAASTSTIVPHTVSAPTALHLAFGVQPPTNVLRGTKLNGVTVEVRDSTNAVVSSDNSTQITLTVPKCNGTSLASIGPVTVVSGVATFSNVPPRFYTLASSLQATAQSSPAYTPDISQSFNVVANAELIFANDFESCRL